MTRVELIQKSLQTNHLSVPERRELIPPTIHLSELLPVLRDFVNRELTFRSHAGILEKSQDGKYRIHRLGLLASRYNDGGLVSDGASVVVATDDYDGLDRALQAFVENTLDSPTGTTIDGIQILGLPSRDRRSPRLVSTSAPIVAIPSDRSIIPGYRIGPVRLAGTMDEIVSLFGPGTERGPGVYLSSVLWTWDAIGLWVVSDAATGNILWVSIDQGGSEPWTDYATPEGIRLGSPEGDVVSSIGAPERVMTGGGAKSLYYDRRGIRFTVPGRILLLLHGKWPFPRKVGAIRIFWPSVLRGDTLIVPGQRISSIEIGMPLDAALAALGGGYQRAKPPSSVYPWQLTQTGLSGLAEMQPAMHVYHWPHLGLTLLEQSGRIISVRAATDESTESAGLKYATADGLGSGSTLQEVKRVYDQSAETRDGLLNTVWWIYRSQGISFAIDQLWRVSHVDVFRP